MYRVPVATLLPGDSPRLTGVDEGHVALLAEVETPLPPILVDRRSRRVIDGMHRLLAAMRRGRDLIEVEFFDGSPEDAFLRAVESNIAHGAPLGQADRRAAAARIVESHPHLSDRSIARSAGLGAKAVAALRRRMTDAGPQSNSRVGWDGVLRPLSTAQGRMAAARFMIENPGASLREVASKSGISLSTASDVRKRIERGDSPVPAGQIEAAQPAAQPDRPARPAREPTATPVADPAPLLNKLLRDPALRYSEDGRLLLQVLRFNSALNGDWVRLLDAVPTHGEDMVVHLAHHFARQWDAFAREVESRAGRLTEAETEAAAPVS